MKVRVNQLTKKSSRPKLQPRMMVNAPTDLALPEIKANPQQLQSKLQRTFSTMGTAGFGSGVGGGMGTGMGGGLGGMGLPPTYKNRCSAASRSARMRSSGGRVASERAVQDALAWLKLQQNSDGSFGQTSKVGMTGLALLAYLGHCETPDSPLYGRTVERALEYILSRAGKVRGLTATSGHGSAYEHGIATYALGEAYIMTGDPDIREPFVRGVQRIIQGQNSDGGWVYEMDGGSKDGDTSVSGWQIQALKAAYLADLTEVEGIEEALDKAMQNLKRVYSNQRKVFGYTDPTSEGQNLTGVGVFCLSMWKHQDSPEVAGGVERVLSLLDRPGKTIDKKMNYQQANLYGMYYNVQAIFVQGGKEWREFNRWFQSSLVEAQNDDGSWPPNALQDNAGGGRVADPAKVRDFQVYRTALCTLMLEVYYRYLPVVDM